LPQLENSDVVKHVLQTLINISSRKTSSGQAISTLYESVNQLKEKYSFLKHVEIKDTSFLELDDPITVLSKIDGVGSNKIGRALQDIIKTMNSNLGKDAGYFFIKELKTRMGADYISTIEDWGLDLGLLQLEFEINELTKKL
jgi:hypothetical protein